MRPQTRRVMTAAASVLLMVACGGGGAPPAAAPGTDTGPGLQAAAPGALVAYVQGRLRQRGATGVETTAGTVVALPAATTAATPDAAFSGPLLQEAGVDEPDLLQSDGSTFYSVGANGAALRLRAWRRAADGSLAAPQALDLPADGAVSVSDEGLLLPGAGVLAVVAQQWHPAEPGTGCGGEVCPATAIAPWPPVWQRSSVLVQRVNVADPASPDAGERVQIDGRLVDSRRVGQLLVVVSTHVPRLALDELPAGATAAEREAAIGRLSAADLLPRQRRNGGAAQPLLADTDCWLQPANGSGSIAITTITVLDLASPALAQRSGCFVGGTEAMYMTPGSLYLATTRWSYVTPGGGAPDRMVYPVEMSTDLHRFVLDAGAPGYRATGTVAGHLGWNPQLKSYRLSEWNGDLRVITFTGQTGWATPADAAGGSAPSPARLTVLRERASDRSLQPLATLPSSRRPELLGKPGEQLHAVRFVGARGYLVTFRTVDPLYVLDLQDPADPRVAGALEVPGFSDQLFPLDDGLLLGVGRDVTDAGRLGGLKVALFDVRDAARPALLNSLALGGAGSSSALDASRHGLNWLRQGDVFRIALPVSLAPVDTSGPWLRGLQRFEVNAAARTLAALPMRGERSDAAWAWPGSERSLQVGPQVYHLRDGTLTAHDW